EPAPRRRGGAARGVAVACVVIASTVLVAVLGLIGYRHSGWRQPDLDRVLVALGAPPLTTATDAPLAAEPTPAPLAAAADPAPEEAHDDVEATLGVEGVEPEVEPGPSAPEQAEATSDDAEPSDGPRSGGAAAVEPSADADESASGGAEPSVETSE